MNRNLLVVLGIVVVVAIAGGIWYFVGQSTRAPSGEAERALREGLGLAQPEEFVYAYPVTGTPLPFDPRCDLACVRRDLEPGKDLAQTGEGPQGYIQVDPAPPGCLLLSERFSPADTDRVTDEPLPIFLDAARIDLMERCNPDVPLRRSQGLAQIPTWYRSVYGVAVSVPAEVITQESTFRMAACVRGADGRIMQFSADETDRYLQSENVTLCEGF